jgi:hypothetical protein
VVFLHANDEKYVRGALDVVPGTSVVTTNPPGSHLEYNALQQTAQPQSDAILVFVLKILFKNDCVQ